MKHLASKLIALLIFTSSISALAQDTRYPLIPYPSKLIAGKGTFIISTKTNIKTDSRFESEAEQLSELLGNGLDEKLSISKSEKNSRIKLVYDASITAAEGYKLSVT